MIGSQTTLRQFNERRTVKRLPVLLPASIGVNEQNFTARILDIAHRGVLMETSGVLEPGISLTFRCGQVDAEAHVVWANCGRYGLEFSKALHDRDVNEQLARAAALESRRSRPVQIHASAQLGCKFPTEKGPT